MELAFIIKIFFVIAGIVTLYAIGKNLDIIKIILIYVKDTLLRK